VTGCLPEASWKLAAKAVSSVPRWTVFSRWERERITEGRLVCIRRGIYLAARWSMIDRQSHRLGLCGGRCQAVACKARHPCRRRLLVLARTCVRRARIRQRLWSLVRFSMLPLARPPKTRGLLQAVHAKKKRVTRGGMATCSNLQVRRGCFQLNHITYGPCCWRF
jgi:hypothetical protein